jgi:hypothetical protein
MYTRGKLVCGVNTGLAEFASRGSDGMWRGEVSAGLRKLKAGELGANQEEKTAILRHGGQ